MANTSQCSPEDASDFSKQQERRKTCSVYTSLAVKTMYLDQPKTLQVEWIRWEPKEVGQWRISGPTTSGNLGPQQVNHAFRTPASHLREPLASFSLMLAHLDALGRHLGAIRRHLAPFVCHPGANMSKNVLKKTQLSSQRRPRQPPRWLRPPSDPLEYVNKLRLKCFNVCCFPAHVIKSWKNVSVPESPKLTSNCPSWRYHDPSWRYHGLSWRYHGPS